MNDTICAISTALGVGAISIIRVSGENSIKIVNKIFKGKNLEKVNTHTINYGYIIDKKTIIDEVLVSIMKAPKTFTKENIVEINCHGGIASTNKILELLLLNGARLATPGEFTKRAFLNGRIDLIKAEAVMDLINSKTEKSLKLSINELTGKVSNLIKNLRQEIIEILANIEVNIDYPEYEDIEEVTNKKILEKLNHIETEIKTIIKESENGKIIKNGITTSIIGKPNVGKSSILNELIEENKAIVTDIEGTTRDIVEGSINIDGILLNIIDTAGIRKTDDIIENIGVNKSLELIEKSDLILYVLDNNKKITEEDKKLYKKINKKQHITIINKIDLKSNIQKEEIKNFKNIIYISTKKEQGVEKIKQKIKQIYNLEQLENKDLTYLSNARAISILKKSLKTLEEAKKGIFKNPIDIIEIDIKKIWEYLGEITGETYQDELIDQLFSQFCLGK